MTRVSVFIDYQNLYHGARETFRLTHEAPTAGHVHPLRLGALLNLLGKPNDPARTLESVNVFRGQPGEQSHPLLVAAFERQVNVWRSTERVKVTTRPLRYPVIAWGDDGRPSKWGKPEEKGIDVLLALSMLRGAINDEFDMAVLMSGDTDLVSAIDAVLEVGKRVENAVWWPDVGYGRALRASNRKIWCHRLNRLLFNQVRDDADYTLR